MISSALQVLKQQEAPPCFIDLVIYEFCLSVCLFFYLVVCWQDGVHVIKKPKEQEEVTEEQKKMMRTQDINYVEMKRVAEVKVTFNFHVISHAEETKYHHCGKTDLLIGSLFT